MNATLRPIEQRVYNGLLVLDSAIDSAVAGTTLGAASKTTAAAQLKTMRDGVRNKKSDEPRRRAFPTLDALV